MFTSHTVVKAEDGGGQSHRLQDCKSHQGCEAWDILLCLHFILWLEIYPIKHTQHCFAAPGDSELRTVLEIVKKPSEVAKVEKQSTSGYKQQGYRSTNNCCHYSCPHPVAASRQLTAGKEETEPKTSFMSDPESPYCKCLDWGTVP